MAQYYITINQKTAATPLSVDFPDYLDGGTYIFYLQAGFLNPSRGELFANHAQLNLWQEELSYTGNSLTVFICKPAFNVNDNISVELDLGDIHEVALDYDYGTC